MGGMDGISQPGYCYELKRKKRKIEESESKKEMDGKPQSKPPEEITMTESLNLFITMDKTQEFTPPTQESDSTKQTNEAHTLTYDDEGSDDRYTLFLAEPNKVIETRVITMSNRKWINSSQQSPN
jgi:hypothetical protein